ncbi:MAG: oligosaccharide flippase family protein [Candidatus Micrarchaeota archaeon]
MNKEKETFVKDTFLVLASNAIVLLTGFFLKPLVGRLLGPTEYGVFALILSAGAILPYILLFSLNAGILFYVAKFQRNPAFVGSVVTTSVLFVLATSIVLFLPTYAVLSVLAPVLGFGGFIAAYLLGVGYALFYLLQAVLQGLERFKNLSFFNTLSALAAAVVSVLAAFYWNNAVLAGFLRASAIVGVSIVGVYSLKRLVKKFGRFDKRSFLSLWNYSKFLGVSWIVGSLIVADRYILAFFHSTREVAYYDLAYSFAIAILPFSISILTTMSPRIIKNESALDAYYKRLSLLNMMILTLFSLGLFYFSDILVFLLLGQDFVAGTVLPLKIIALTLPLMAVYSLNSVVFTSLNKPRTAAVLGILLAVASIAFNLLLVPSFASVGASVANAGTYLLAVAVGFYYLLSKHSISLKPTVLQFGLFLLFIASYAIIEAGGFPAKTAFFLLFVILTILLQKTAVLELAGLLKKMVLKR